jgi:hypothetical protein
MDHSGSGTPPLIRALIADDHLVVRRGIGALLSSISGIEVVAEAGGYLPIPRRRSRAPGIDVDGVGVLGLKRRGDRSRPSW